MFLPHHLSKRYTNDNRTALEAQRAAHEISQAPIVFQVSRLITSPPAKIEYNTPMEKVMDIFENTGAWNLPVIDENGIYKGFVSKSKIFNSYRRVLVHYSND